MRRRERYKIIRNCSGKTSYILFLRDYRLCGNRARIGELDEPFLEYVSWGQPEGAGATTVAWFWGLMSIGCLLGLVIVKLIDSKLMLRIFSMIAILNLAIALFGPTQVAIIAFACCGFSISIMFSVIFAFSP